MSEMSLDNIHAESAVVKVEEEVEGLDCEEERVFTIRLEGCKDVELDMSLIGISRLINTSLDNGTEETVMILNKDIVKTNDQLNIIVEYMNLCKKYNKSNDIKRLNSPLKTKNLYDNVGEDLPKEIIDFVLSIRDKYGGMGIIYDVINISNYLDIPGLLYCLCAYIAAQLKNECVEDIIKILDVNDPMTGDTEVIS